MPLLRPWPVNAYAESIAWQIGCKPHPSVVVGYAAYGPPEMVNRDIRFSNFGPGNYNRGRRASVRIDIERFS
jgi:hypothetical protein